MQTGRHTHIFARAVDVELLTSAGDVALLAFKGSKRSAKSHDFVFKPSTGKVGVYKLLSRKSETTSSGREVYPTVEWIK